MPVAHAPLHFDGPMVAGGLGYPVDETLSSPRPATFSSGVEWIDQLTGGIEPGSVWTVSGPAGVGVTAFVRRLAVAAAQSSSVILANGHVPTRHLARMVAHDARTHQDADHSRLPQVASWLPLPTLGSDAWDDACRATDVVVLDTWDEMWRPGDWARSREERIADARWLRELARSAHTAVVLTARLPRTGTEAPHLTEDVFGDVADVQVSIDQEPDSPWRRATVHARGIGSSSERLPHAAGAP